MSQEWSRLCSKVGYALLLISFLLISVAWFMTRNGWWKLWPREMEK